MLENQDTEEYTVRVTTGTRKGWIARLLGSRPTATIVAALVGLATVYVLHEQQQLQSADMLDSIVSDLTSNDTAKINLARFRLRDAAKIAEDRIRPYLEYEGVDGTHFRYALLSGVLAREEAIPLAEFSIEMSHGNILTMLRRLALAAGQRRVWDPRKETRAWAYVDIAHKLERVNPEEADVIYRQIQWLWEETYLVASDFFVDLSRKYGRDPDRGDERMERSVIRVIEAVVLLEVAATRLGSQRYWDRPIRQKERRDIEETLVAACVEYQRARRDISSLDNSFQSTMAGVIGETIGIVGKEHEMVESVDRDIRSSLRLHVGDIDRLPGKINTQFVKLRKREAALRCIGR